MHDPVETLMTSMGGVNGETTSMVGILVARRMSGGRSSSRAALRAASTGSMPANGGRSSNSWYAIICSTSAKKSQYMDDCASLRKHLKNMLLLLPTHGA